MREDEFAIFFHEYGEALIVFALRLQHQVRVRIQGTPEHHVLRRNDKELVYMRRHGLQILRFELCHFDVEQVAESALATDLSGH